MPGKQWKVKELQKLKQLLREGYRPKAIGIILDRSERAVQEKMTREKLQTRVYWNEDEDKILIKMKEEKRSYQEISEMLPLRTVKAITDRINYLGMGRVNAHELIMRWADGNHRLGQNQPTPLTITGRGMND